MFPEAQHVACSFHLLKNLRSKFQFYGQNKLLEKCALETDFEKYMCRIQSINPKVSKYLFEADFGKWALSHAVKSRYWIMNSNNLESLNATLNEARELPFLSFILCVLFLFIIFLCSILINIAFNSFAYSSSFFFFAFNFFLLF